MDLLALLLEHADTLITFAAGALATGIAFFAKKNVFAKKLANETAKKLDAELDD